MKQQEILKKLSVQDRYAFADLLEIMDILRGENGCPWDREQTHESIRSNCLEEAYEVVDAIDSGDPERLCEELGDMMLQTVFHAAISKDNGGFDFDDVVDALCKKLVSRHTHIFGEVKARDSGEALVAWEKAKEVEKATRGVRAKVDAVPKCFPAMLRAEKVLKYTGLAANDGNKAYADLEMAFGGLTEKADENTFGDFLLAALNFARVRGIDSEAALKKSVDRLSDKI